MLLKERLSSQCQKFVGVSWSTVGVGLCCFGLIFASRVLKRIIFSCSLSIALKVFLACRLDLEEQQRLQRLQLYYKLCTKPEPEVVRSDEAISKVRRPSGDVAPLAKGFSFCKESERPSKDGNTFDFFALVLKFKPFIILCCNQDQALPQK